MKKLLVIFTLITTLNTHAGLFDNGEKERRIQAEQQLQQERQANDGLGIVILILGVGCVALLTVGAAVGASVRHAAKKS